jgi:ABC-type multidrug transport system ATPase subunit
VAIIDKGHLLYEGTVRELISENVRIKVKPDQVSDAFKFLSKYSRLSVTRNGDQCLYVKLAEDEIPAVNMLLVQHDFRVMELSRVRETLEEVFLRLTRDVRHTDQKIDN